MDCVGGFVGLLMEPSLMQELIARLGNNRFDLQLLVH